METTDKIVYTGGTFDIPHVGHVNFLRNCSKLGKVVVALNTDEFIERYKGSCPVFSYEERKKIIESLEYVDRVIPNTDGEDSKSTILEVYPDFIAIGSDWATKDYYEQMNFTQDWLDTLDITLVYIPYYQHMSTSKIKQRCQK